MNIDMPQRGEESPFTLCQLQDSLNDDDDGTFKEETLEFFCKWFQEFNKEIAEGLSPDEYEKAKLLADCAGLAGGLINAYWIMIHESD